MRNLREYQTNTRTAASPPLPAPERGEQARRDPAAARQAQPIAISRTLGRVVVTIQVGLDRDITSVLRQVLVDLVDNQGNLDVALEFRSASPIAVASVELIADVAERVRLRGGALSVNRRSG